MLMLLVLSIALGQATSKKTDSRAGATSSVADAIIAKEKQVTDALMKKDAKGLDSLLASLERSEGRTSHADFKKDPLHPNYTLRHLTFDREAAVLVTKAPEPMLSKGRPKR
jgi:hypothetical protein